jgi:hypothetical protein
MDVQSVMDRLRAKIAESIFNRQPGDSASWEVEEGVLITRDEAQLCLDALDALASIPRELLPARRP